MSGSDSAPKSKFAKAKPSLANGKASGRKISTNTYSLTHPTILKLNEKSNRGQWCVTEVLYDPGKRFNAEAVTPGKGKPTYHPKPKYLCWINFANKEDLGRTYFSYAMQLKDGTFRTLTWVQEKRVLGALSYRNGIRIMQDKSGLDTERVKAYGNRLPRVGVLAGGDQPLHHVGFLSDRHAIKELELQSYEELCASDELLYGETKPYIPKYLAGLTTGVEEENDEIDVAEDDSEDEEEEDEEEDVPDEEDDEDVMEVDEAAAAEDESDQNESEQLEPVNLNKESLAVSRAMRGSKFEQIRDTVSKTDMLVLQEQLAVEGSGNKAVQRGRNTNMSEAPKQPAKKRKNENTKQSAPKKQKAVPSAPKPKKSKSPPKKPAEPKKTSPKKTSPSRKSASPKRPAEPKKKTASKAKPAAPVKAPAAVAAASAVNYHKFYTTADKMAEGREKVMSNEKALLAFTDPARAAVLQEETRLSDLLKGKADPATLGVVVPFLYELFCKHYDLPVPDPRTMLQGSSKMRQLSAELLACSHWQEAIHIANTIIDSAKKEKEEERKSMPLIALMNEAVQRRDEESLQILHTLVLAEQATIKIGIEALGSDTAGEYLDTLKDIELQKDLFNILNAFLDYVKPDDGEESEQASPPEEEFNMFD